MIWLPLTLSLILGAEPAADPQLTRGAFLFAERCVVCHGEKGKGDGVAAKSLKPPPADLTAGRFEQSYLDHVMRTGVPGTSMPAQQDLSVVDRSALVKFVSSLAPAAPAPGKPEALALGRDVYEIRCAACHGAGGEGSGLSRARFTRPPADFTRKQPTRERIVQVLENGVPGTAMTPMKRLLNAKELEGVVAYLQSTYGTGAAVGVPPR